MRYMLLFCGSEEDRRAFEAMSEEELRARYGEVAAWFAAHDARITATAQLQPRETATTVRFPPEGEPLVLDGPFLEGREDIGGYAAIDVEDFDAALAMARARRAAARARPWRGGARGRRARAGARAEPRRAGPARTARRGCRTGAARCGAPHARPGTVT